AAPGDVIQRAVDLLGSEITGNRFPVDEEAFQNIAGGKLVVVQGGIYRMSFQRYPAALCKAVEKALGLADFYSIGFVRKNEILGSATIITVGKNARIDTQAVEAFARQASIALHKRASEDALRESEQKLRTFIAQSPEGMVLLDESGSIIEWNAEAERLSGVQRSQVLTRKMWEVEHLLLSDEEVAHGLAEDHHRQLLNALTSGMLTGPDRFMLHPIHRLTGEVRHIAVALSIIKTGRGHMIAITGRDLTGQMDAEARSRKSEEEFRLVWEQSFDGMRLIDYEGTIVMVNQAFCRLVGMDSDALIGKPFSQVYEKRHQRTMLEHEKELIKTRALEANFERRYVLWDGRAVWLQLSNSFIERAPGTVLLLSIFRDVTKRHHSEEILRFQSEILNRIGDAVIVTDDSYHVIYMNAAAEKMYTTTTESSIGRLIGELYHWHESAHAGQTEIFSEAATKGLSHAESIQVLPDGLEFLAELTISRSNAISNQKQAFIVVIRDVTEHRRSEEAVRNSEQKYRSVVECSNDGIVLVDEGGVILEWNHGQELISGLERQDAVGKLIWDVQYRLAPDEKKTPENYEHIKETGLRFVNAGNPGATGTVYENIIQRPDGERCVIQIVHSPVQTEKGFMIMSIARQVPIRQNLEFQNTSFTPPPIKG
ncbi:MAG: PAS domain S-box protein, partial [Ignavibacteriales bacterium]|nr:PAS domain S-box protein [Ignavibacteriales bacterium]